MINSQYNEKTKEQIAMWIVCNSYNNWTKKWINLNLKLVQLLVGDSQDKFYNKI